MCLWIKIMHSVVLKLAVCLVYILLVNCETSLVSADKYTSRKVKNFSKKSIRKDEIFFCEIGCVLYDSYKPPLIDDPGRNFYDTFSVISASYVIEVVGGYSGLSEDRLRVMVSDKVLGSRNSTTSARLQMSDRLQETLILGEGDVIQRITFNLHADMTLRVDSKAPEGFLVRIPRVVPHVVFMHDYKLEHGGEEVTGVVVIEASNMPMTLEVEVGRLEDGRCWVKPLDRRKFEDYIVAVRVRGNNRHRIGIISITVQSHVEERFPFGVYMEELNEFAFRFLVESLLQTRNVIKESKTFVELCKTISRDPQKPEKSTKKPPDFAVGDSNPIVISIGIKNRNKM